MPLFNHEIDNFKTTTDVDCLRRAREFIQAKQEQKTQAEKEKEKNEEIKRRQLGM